MEQLDTRLRELIGTEPPAHNAMKDDSKLNELKAHIDELLVRVLAALPQQTSVLPNATSS